MKTLFGLLMVGLLAGCETVPKQVLPYVMRDAAVNASLDLYLYDLELGASRVLRQTPMVDEIDPAVDPMGQRVAYVERNTLAGQGIFNLSVYDLSAGQSEVVIASATPLSSPAWSNNGKQLAYVVERDGKLQVKIKDTATNAEPKTIAFGSDPSWRVDDRAIFYSSRDTLAAPAGDLMVHELKKGLNQSLTLRGNGFANLARGTSVVYTTLPYSRRNEAVWIIDANNRQKRLSSPGKSYRDLDPVHINGSKFVAFTRTDVATKQASIYVVERYANDPVETLLFEAKGDAYTKGAVDSP